MRRRNLFVITGMLTLIIVFILSSCSTAKVNEVTSTQVEVIADDETKIVSSGLMIKLDIDELVEKSDAIVIAKVGEILPSEQYYDDILDQNIIYTDVILDVKSVLLGKMQSNRIAIKVLGGRIGKTVMTVSDSPVFKFGEESVLFLQRLSQKVTHPLEIDSADYYVVYGSVQGKYEYKDNSMISYQGNQVAISDIEQKIVSIHKGI